MSRKLAPHGEIHPVAWLALEFGVDKARLQRLVPGPCTIREAYEKLSGKLEKESDLRRRQKAEADAAEITAAEKRGTLMLKAKAVRWFSDFGTFVRAQIMGTKLSDSEKKRVCTTISEWEPDK